METNWNQLIERYLNNELSAEDKIKFEKALQQNQELQAEFELHKLTQEVIRRNSLRKLVQKSGKWFHFKKVLVTTGIVLAGIALLTTIYFISTNSFTDQKVKGIDNELLEKMEKHLKFDNIPSQYFEYTGKADVFLSKTGVMISLTDHSFLLNGKPYSGNALVQWQEAQTASDFAKAGLSTKAGDRLLETQGMFSLNAFTPDGQRLELSKEGAYIQVPVDEVKEGMKLFEGIALENGDVDWQNPVELDRLPKQKSMNEMDLYPNEYEPKLNELKWHTEKQKRDSLYLSFDESSFRSDTIASNWGITNTMSVNDDIRYNQRSKIAKVHFSIQELNNEDAYIIVNVDLLPNWYINSTAPLSHSLRDLSTPTEIGKMSNSSVQLVGKTIDNNTLSSLSDKRNFSAIKNKAVFKQKIKIKKNENKFNISIKFQLFNLELTEVYEFTNHAVFSKNQGETLFNRRCVTCHSPTKEGTGPKLQGVRAKWLDGGAKEESIYNWVRDWEKAANKDPYAANAVKIKPTNMDKNPHLSNEDIDAIFDYVDAQTNFIPPSKVLAIWNTKFDNTILATQDFEDRMKLIHETCDEAVLKMYTDNLNESLWKLDERVVAMGYPQFQQFANQRVGKLKIDDAHQQNLADFYDKAVKSIRDLGQKNYEEALRKEQKWDNELQNERKNEVIRSGTRKATNFQEEYNFNHGNVRKQLGFKVGFVMTTNIVNIDKYVMEATIARKTTEIVNPFTGEVGVITYNPMSAEVKNANQYDKLYMYLFSKEMNSYQRLDFENGKLNYSLNGDMKYDAAIIGMNENGYFYHEIKNLSAGNLGSISLENISEKEFDKRINVLNNKRTEKPMSITEELQWLFKEKANYEVQKQRKKDAEFRDELRIVVFPCLGSESYWRNNQGYAKQAK